MRCLVFIVIILWEGSARGQLNNQSFEDRMEVDPADSGKLLAGVNALGFFKNNEFSRTLIDGYTLFGYQFQPFLSYHLSSNLRLDAGAFLQKDFGNDQYTTATPVFSVKWNQPCFSVIFGNLEGSLNHRLVEPLYDFERVLNNRLETGVQFILDKDGLFADAWLDWRYMQYWKDPRQEEFVAGISLNKRVLAWESGSLSLPLQVVARHRGGQLDLAGLPVQTVVNTAAGLVWNQSLPGALTAYSFSGYYLFDKDVSHATQPYQDGSGFYVNGSVSTRIGLELMVSYWQANEFLSIQGGQIYPSLSPQDGVTLQPSPQLMIVRFLYNHKVADNLTLAARFEPHVDLAFDTFQYAYGFYINYRARYFLANPRR